MEPETTENTSTTAGPQKPESAEPEYTPPAHGWRTFLVVWSTQALSIFGTALTGFAVTIWLTQVLFPRPDQKAELAWALAAEGLAFGLPTILFAPIAGAWADRHDRKRTMFIADLVNGGLSLILLTLISTGTLQLWMLLILLAVFATSSSFHGSAFDTSYAMLVPESKLPRANGMMQTIWSLSGIVTPALAATLIALPAFARDGLLPEWISGWLASLRDGTPIAIGLDAATFFAAAAVLPFLHIPSPARTDLRDESGKMKKSMWADVKEGGQYIWRRKPLLWLLGSFTLINFVATIANVFLPLLLRFNLQSDWQRMGFTFESALALIGTLGAVGGLAGGIFISTWGGLKKKRIYGVLVPMLVTGFALVTLGLSPFLYLTAAMLLFQDAMIPFMNAHSQAIWQTQTPRELQGRVFSVRRVIAQFSWPLATVAAGALGGAFNPGIVIAVLGTLFVVFVIGQLFNPYMRRVEDKAFLEELAAKAGERAAQREAARKPAGTI
jgi:MFS transporter, DHA3 family, macrolide efflux protein